MPFDPRSMLWATMAQQQMAPVPYRLDVTPAEVLPPTPAKAAPPVPTAPQLPPMSPEEIRNMNRERQIAALRQQMTEKLSRSMEAQDRGIDQKAQRIQEFARMGDKPWEAKMDWSPLAAIGKQAALSAPATAFVTGYMPPKEMSKEDRFIMKEKLENELQRDRRNLTQDEIALMKSQMNSLLYEKQVEAQGLVALAKSGKLKESKGKSLSPNIIRDYTQYQGAVEDLMDLKDVLKQNQKIMGPVSGGVLGANPYDAERKVLQSRFDRVRQTIGKMLEGGVLRKEDEEKYRKILPNITDLPKVADAKLNSLEDRMRRDLNSYMDNFGKAGYNISGFKEISKTNEILSKGQPEERITVTNGDKTYDILPSDLEAAKADGFKVLP